MHHVSYQQGWALAVILHFYTMKTEFLAWSIKRIRLRVGYFKMLGPEIAYFNIVRSQQYRKPTNAQLCISSYIPL